MKESIFPSTAQQIGALTEAQIVGDPHRGVNRFSSLLEAENGGLSFCGSLKFKKALAQAKDSVVLIRPEWVDLELPITYLVVDHPQEAFVKLTKEKVHGWAIKPGTISPKADISPDAVLAPGVTVGPFACIEKGVRIGAGSFIGAGSVVGAGTTIGTETKIHPRVVIYPETEIGDRVEIFPGSVLGSDGFGLLGAVDGHKQMPHIGKVVIEDDVRIGAGSTIDRGTLGETRLCSGVKIDNQVHIAHNCKIGKNSIICALSGLAGSVVLEKNVILGGQAGIKNGITIGEGAKVGAQAGVGHSLEAGGTYTGSPATTVAKQYQMLRYLRRLPRLLGSESAGKLTGIEKLTDVEKGAQ